MFITITPGAGDHLPVQFAAELLTMYRKWAHARGIIVSSLTDPKTGQTSLLIPSEHWQALKNEHGVHRRIYWSEEDQARHTVFALVEVSGMSGWNSQIRSYTSHPYTLVKNHYDDWETEDIQAVFNGKLPSVEL